MADENQKPTNGKTKTHVTIRGIEHQIACFSCHESKPAYANMHLTEPKKLLAFGVLILCEKCSNDLHAGNLRMQPPMTYPADPKNTFIMPPGTGKKPDA